MALTGIKVIEFAGLAPGPFAGLILADNGASVIRVDRPGSSSADLLSRKKRSLAINPKIHSGLLVLKNLIAQADILIDPFRPGVLERLGLGPNVFLAQDGINRRLVYARIVGFPRSGPYKDMAGHDINYLALSGVLSMLPGLSDKPSFPLNILADFAGGGLTCALGILLALAERNTTDFGKVVDIDMVSGVRYLSSFPLIHTHSEVSPLFSGKRGTNVLDGGAPFYDVYTCRDGGWMSVGCLEPQFFAAFLQTLSTSLPADFSVAGGWKPTQESQMDRESWPQMKEFFEKAFMTKERGYWARIFHGTDACVVPVLTPHEAGELDPSGQVPVAHPRVGQEKAAASILLPGQHTDEILTEMGLSEEEKAELSREGATGSVQVPAKL